MKILAIETSCDDTAVSIVENGVKVLTHLVASQETLHAKFGGVVPEVASREHLKAIYPLIDMALKRAKLTVKNIDAIAVTAGPGLLGSLLVGVNAAKTLGYLWNKPVIPVNHLQAHIYAGKLGGQSWQFPVVGLVASGGHSEIVLLKKEGDYIYLGGTRDDAAGEAFDKVARILGAGYPGGPAIAKLAEGAKGGKITLPRPMVKEVGLDFSFSGLKTAALRAKAPKAELAHEFQEVVNETLTDRLQRAVERYKAKTVIIGGGVAANRNLRAKVEAMAQAKNLPVLIPDFRYCTDNASMIGAAAYFGTSKKKRDWYNVGVAI